MTTDAMRVQYERTRTQAHPNCVVCGASNAHGLQLDFACLEDGSVEATFFCATELQGYPGRLHGGVITSLLDGAMANCMFARGAPSVTAELNVRFPHPVQCGYSATIRAWIKTSHPLFHELHAELRQQSTIKATARGIFMAPPASSGAGGI